MAQSQAATRPAASKMRLKWHNCGKAPFKAYHGSAVVDGHTVYFYGITTDSLFKPGAIYSYDSHSGEWSILPDCLVFSFSIVVVTGYLTVVGGYRGGTTNTLFSLVGEGWDRKWVEHFPPMPTKQQEAAVLCSGKSLVVAGGRDEMCCPLDTVEVMDTETRQWSTASSLPLPRNDPSMTVQGDRIYLLGGFTDRTDMVFTSSLCSLLQSCKPLCLDVVHTDAVWRQIADCPATQSTCTTLNGQLLAVGGKEKQMSSASIHAYDPVFNSWEVISRMSTPRGHPVVAVLPGSRLMVVSGWISDSSSITLNVLDTVEIATLE